MKAQVEGQEDAPGNIAVKIYSFNVLSLGEDETGRDPGLCVAGKAAVILE